MVQPENTQQNRTIHKAFYLEYGFFVQIAIGVFALFCNILTLCSKDFYNPTTIILFTVTFIIYIAVAFEVMFHWFKLYTFFQNKQRIQLIFVILYDLGFILTLATSVANVSQDNSNISTAAFVFAILISSLLHMMSIFWFGTLFTDKVYSFFYFYTFRM